mmetsp:Transcript_42985/g.98753  ORF Transcript_42985/g.98753 Transcript_42985/m.98753 type:complete len:99 (+) Transcript_42985:2327-2623(+)
MVVWLTCPLPPCLRQRRVRSPLQRKCRVLAIGSELSRHSRNLNRGDIRSALTLFYMDQRKQVDGADPGHPSRACNMMPAVLEQSHCQLTRAELQQVRV